MLPTGPADASRELCAVVRERFGQRVERTRLFGSYARGDWGPDSDVDVLVVVRGLTEPERREIFDLAWDIYAQRLIHVNPLALSDAEWADLVSRERRIVADIEREGIAL